MSFLNKKTVETYCDFLVLPLKLIACWDWYETPKKDREIFINNMYLAAILFFTMNSLSSLIIEIYVGWTGFMSSLDLLNEAAPVIVMLSMVVHFTNYREKFYELIQYIDDNFKWHSARGLTNMTMQRSYETAKRFSYLYTGCVFFSVSMYTLWPIIIHLVTEQPLQPWIYAGETSSMMIAIIFIRQYLLQIALTLIYGQYAAVIATMSILIAGQLDLLCCSLHNLRHTAFLKNNVQYEALVSQFKDIVEDERHRYSYNESVMKDSYHNFDEVKCERSITQLDAYSSAYDDDTCNAIRDCAKMYQAINICRKQFEDFISHLLVIRIIQGGLFLCVILYVATLQLDLPAIQYVFACILDIFIYCYFGNQIIVQADRVSTAVYQSGWHTMGVRPRRLLLHMMLSCRRPLMIRAGNFLPIDLNTFVLIIKTSFSYYTLLLNFTK